MPAWLKVVLSITVVFLVAIAASAYFGVQWMKKAFNEEGPRTMQEGRDFVKAHPDANVFDEAMNRARKCGGLEMSCATQVMMWFNGAMEEKPLTPEQCAAVPDPEKTLERSQWPQKFCEAQDLKTHLGCTMVAGAFAARCDKAL